MKKSIFLLVTISVAFCLQSMAQGMGWVNRSEIHKSIPGFLADIKMIDSMQVVYETELMTEGQKLQAQARDIVAAYDPQPNENLAAIKKRMKASDTMALNAIFQKDAALDKKKQNYDTKLQQMQAQKIDPVLTKIAKAIKLVAEEENLDAVYFLEDVSVGLVYINPKRNFTQKVIAKLKTL